MINVSIIGATGYVGLELVKLLSVHPRVKLNKLLSKSYAGQKYSDIYPALRNLCDIPCSDADSGLSSDDTDIVITALPPEASKEYIPSLIKSGIRVIDHSGQFRFRDVSTYEKWYNTSHGMPLLNESAVYGLPELYRDEIEDAFLVANPGCYPTCSLIPLIPLITENMIENDSIVINAVSGVSGAGRQSKVSFSFCEIDAGFKAYGITKHRHTGEIEQELSLAAKEDIVITFTPHLAPFKRGMSVTTYARLKGSAETSDLLHLCRKRYQNDPFIRVYENGSFPEVKNVVGSNFLDIGLITDKRTNGVIIVSALDNLLKGAAGQAVQVLNIMAGFNETEGLMKAASYL